MEQKVGLNVQNEVDTEVAEFVYQQQVEQYLLCGNFKTHTFTGPGTFQVTAGAGPNNSNDYI